LTGGQSIHDVLRVTLSAEWSQQEVNGVRRSIKILSLIRADIKALTPRQRPASGSATLTADTYTVNIAPASHESASFPQVGPGSHWPDLLDVAASMLKAPADEITAVTVVDVAHPSGRRTLPTLVRQIAASQGLSASVRFSDGSVAVRFSHAPSRRAQARWRTATTGMSTSSAELPCARSEADVPRINVLVFNRALPPAE
jgi:hypothetical protein